LESICRHIALDLDAHTDVLVAVPNLLILAQESVEVQVAFQSRLYRGNLVAPGGGMVDQRGGDAASQGVQNELHRIVRLVLAQQNLVLRILHDEPIASLGIASAKEAADGAGVVTSVLPFVLDAELEVRNGWVPLTASMTPNSWSTFTPLVTFSVAIFEISSIICFLVFL